MSKLMRQVMSDVTRFDVLAMLAMLAMMPMGRLERAEVISG